MILIKNGDVMAPEPLGKKSILTCYDRILKIDANDLSEIKKLNLHIEEIDATNCWVTPGFIDPHEHIIGGSGEQGFSSQTPDITLQEILRGGITTVIGCIGSDTITRPMPALLGAVKALNEDGITAFCYTGGYRVPPRTLTAEVSSDIMFIQEIIGTGEVAISDSRSSDPRVNDLAQIVKATHVAGILTKKGGVTHFHLGLQKKGMDLLFELIDDCEVVPECIYPTHISKNDKLLEQAAKLTQRGSWVDIDTTHEDIAQKVQRFLELGGKLEKLTISSDACQNTPESIFWQIRDCVLKHKIPFEKILPVVTKNTSDVLRLPAKGALREANDADLLVIDKSDFTLKHVIAKGDLLFKDGKVIRQTNALKNNKRYYVHRGEVREEI